MESRLANGPSTCTNGVRNPPASHMFCVSVGMVRFSRLEIALDPHPEERRAKKQHHLRIIAGVARMERRSPSICRRAERVIREPPTRITRSTLQNVRGARALHL